MNNYASTENSKGLLKDVFEFIKKEKPLPDIKIAIKLRKTKNAKSRSKNKVLPGR